MSDKIGLRNEPLTAAAPAATKETAPYLGPVLVLLIGGFMTFLDTSIVNVALAKIMNVFNRSPSIR